MSIPDIVLQIYIPSDLETLRAFYNERIILHNNHILHNNYPDSGFDLAIPNNLLISKTISNKIKLGVHCAMFINGQPQAYYLYPRSSISKTPLRLCNSVGIIDSGYRGEIMAVVDKIDNNIDSFQILALERYFQICHPMLWPFKVEMVNSLQDLGTTERGDGGFGSTGV